MFKAKIDYKNLARNNICGIKIYHLRKMHKWSQTDLAVQLQRNGLHLDRNAIQRIESGQRFITDIELPYFAEVLQTNLSELYGQFDLK